MAQIRIRRIKWTVISPLSRICALLLVVAIIAGCDRGKVEKLEAENTKLKGELERVQEQLKELAVKQKQDLAAREQEEAKRKQEAVEREQAETKRKQELVEQEQKAKREQEAKKVEGIGKCFERIFLRMDALKDEPRDFAFKSKPDREALEARLKSLANTKKEEMGEVLIELRSVGYTNTFDLDRQISAFVNSYGYMISYSRMNFDAIEGGRSKEDRDRLFASELKFNDQMQAASLAIIEMWDKTRKLESKP